MLNFAAGKVKLLYNGIKTRTVGNHELSSMYFKQFSATLVIKGLSAIISIIYVPIVLGFLDQEKYGIWVTLTTIVHWIRILDIGMGGGMRNKLGEAISLNQHHLGRIHVSTTYGILGGIYLLALIMFYIINPSLNWQSILNTSIISQSELARIALISVTFIILGFILQPVTLVYKAHGNSAAGDFIQLLISFISLLFIWLASLWADKGNLLLLAWIVTGIPVLVYLVASVYTFLFKFPHFRPSFRMIKISESKGLFTLSLQFLVSAITSLIIYGSISFVIVHLFSPKEVTVFNIAYSIFNLPIVLISLLTAPTLPLVTQAYTKRDYNWIRFMLRRINKMSYLIVAGIIIMIVLSPLIYRVWIGDKATIPFMLSASLGIYAIINVLQIPYSTFTNGTGKILINTILSPISIGVYVILSILLSKWLDNVIGVSLALSITCLIGLIILPGWLRKQLSTG